MINNNDDIFKKSLILVGVSMLVILLLVGSLAYVLLNLLF